jgi:type II secretory pathway predicted ATPase ExeA
MATASLSVVFAGHPKLKNDLRRPTMEEIGYRTDVFSLDRHHRQPTRIHSLAARLPVPGTQAAEPILTEEAIDLLATKLRTPLQIQAHLDADA